MNNYKPYHTYKDSGESWMGKIPEHWNSLKLKHIFSEKKITHNKNLSCGSISFGEVVYKNDDSVPLSTKASYQEVLKGEYLVNPLNLNYDLKSLRIGLSEIDVVVSSGYIVLRNHAEINKSYYKWLLHRYDVAYMKLLGSGVRQTINFNHIANSILAFPDLKEQISIANFLDYKTAQIKDLIALKEKTIELLKERKTAIINQAVTKGLATNVEMKDSGIEWLGEIPKHWEVLPTKRIVKVKITDGPHETPVFEDMGIPFLSADAVKHGKLDFNRKRGYISEKTHKTYCEKVKPQKDDIFIVKSGSTTGNPCIVETDEEFSIWSPLALIRVNERIISSKYAFFSVQANYYQRQVQDNWSYGTQPNIGMGVLENLVLIIPSIEEQEKIIDFIRPKIKGIETLISQAEKEIEIIKEYQQSVISEAVTGKIDVREHSIAS